MGDDFKKQQPDWVAASNPYRRHGPASNNSRALGRRWAKGWLAERAARCFHGGVTRGKAASMCDDCIAVTAERAFTSRGPRF